MKDRSREPARSLPSPRGGACRFAAVVAWVAAAVPILACSGGAQSAAKTPIFGGEGAVVAGPQEQPLPKELAPTKDAAGPCAAPSPPSDVALLDDFEDGDQAAFKGFQREGWWFAAADATPGARLSPDHGNFRPERLALDEAHKDDVLAAHLRADGQKDWGAVWGVALHWASKGIRCPLNLSSFAGVRFRAKGPGTLRVAFGIPDTQPTESGGTCTSGCYDLHGKLVYLGDRWEQYFVPWNLLEQGGWGAEARFDPARVVTMQFSVRPQDLPADLWLDDIYFVTPNEAPALAAAQHAQPAPPPVRVHDDPKGLVPASEPRAPARPSSPALNRKTL